jgi:hypothetical protein
MNKPKQRPITTYRPAPSRAALLTYERAVNDNIPAQQLRDVAKNKQCRVTEHLKGLAANLQERKGW